jgi:hypothetical protein
LAWRDEGLSMSLDGVSPKSPSLRLASTSAKSAASDSAHRRPAIDDKRLVRPAPPESRPAQQIQQVPRRFPRYVPAANVAQLLLDVLLISATQATVLLLIYQRLGLEGMAQAGVVVCFSVLVVLLFFYATGCYRRDALLEFAALPPSSIENAEKLEQLRVLQAGHDIFVGVVEHASSGIDTPADYAAFVARRRAG